VENTSDVSNETEVEVDVVVVVVVVVVVNLLFILKIKNKSHNFLPLYCTVPFESDFIYGQSKV